MLSEALQTTGAAGGAEGDGRGRAVAKATRLDDLLARYEQTAEPAVNLFANDTAGRVEVPRPEERSPR